MRTGDGEPVALDAGDGKVDVARDRVVTGWIRLMLNDLKAQGFLLDDAVGKSAPSCVPCLSSDMIDNLLREATPRLTRNALMKVIPNACVMGDKCIGQSADIPGLRHGPLAPLMAWMSPKEFKDMHDHGVVPIDPRRCVLCEAYQSQIKYNTARMIIPRPSTGENYINHDMQGFCIRVDEEGGYKSEYCIPFSKDGCVMAAAGMISPIFMPQLSLLENKYTPSGVRYVSQERIKHEFQSKNEQYF